jgi:hypothetical protein
MRTSNEGVMALIAHEGIVLSPYLRRVCKGRLAATSIGQPA